MILVFHILIAVGSLAYSTYIFFRPSVVGVRNTSAMTVMTLASGTYLAVSQHSHLLQACMNGLFYLSGVSIGIFAASYKLATAKQHDQ
jgi:hypothetical protein